MNKQLAGSKLPYGVGIAIVFIIILYGLSFILQGNTQQTATTTGTDSLAGLAIDTSTGSDAIPADPAQMYLGMKTWQWSYAKDAEGTKTTPAEGKLFTLTFDFEKGVYAVTTDCNDGGGTFSAESGSVTFDAPSMTEKACTGSQESIFTSYLAQAKHFYFNDNAQMLLQLEDNTYVVFK